MPMGADVFQFFLRPTTTTTKQTHLMPMGADGYDGVDGDDGAVQRGATICRGAQWKCDGGAQQNHRHGAQQNQGHESSEQVA